MSFGKGRTPRVGDQGGDVGHEGETPGRYDAVLIAGPTASGKSALALRLARRGGCLVINADSMQVYGDLRILTARPAAADEAAVPHRLFGTVDGAVNHSVGKWLVDAAAALAEARSAGRLPILVGGTGLYFKALTRGISDIPAVPETVRDEVRREATGLWPAQLHARLAARDPQMAARLRPSDPQRILRALEVLATTGRSLSSFQGMRAPPLLADGDYVGAFLTPGREALATAIDRRFLAMLNAGALEEVRALAERALDPALPVMRAHGVPGLLAHLRGEISLAEAIARGQGDTRRYVKRQFTFARHQLRDFAWMTADEAEGAILRARR